MTLITSFPLTNSLSNTLGPRMVYPHLITSMNISSSPSLETSKGTLQSMYSFLFPFVWAVYNWCYSNKATDCQTLVCKLFLSFTVFLLNLQAIVIIAKLSFWINKGFLPSVTEALDQYREKGYVQKLKTNITSDSIFSVHQDIVTSLFRQVTDFDSMYMIPCLVMHFLWTIYGRVKSTTSCRWFTGYIACALRSYLFVHRPLLICIPIHLSQIFFLM